MQIKIQFPNISVLIFIHILRPVAKRNDKDRKTVVYSATHLNPHTMACKAILKIYLFAELLPINFSLGR